jgi:hypothetical protein
MGWRVDPTTIDLRVLALALETTASVGHPVDDDVLDAYAAAALQVAEIDVDGIPVHDRPLAVETVVLGTVLREPILLALRRLAHQHVSALRFSPSSERGAEDC